MAEMSSAHPRSISLALLRRSRPWVAHVADWLEGERAYVEAKFPAGSAPHEDASDPQKVVDFINQYLSRALVLGLENPLGRQALAKAARITVGFTETVVRDIGPIPPSGSPSGQLS